MKKITIAYFGSPDFSAKLLEKLLTDKDLLRLIEVKLVVTQPDQPVGRKQILTSTPVKTTAEKYFESEDIKFLSLSGLGVPAVIKNFGIELKNIDLALVYAYGAIVPKDFLFLPKYGFWNIHPSLLPKYRGTAPMATPLINGDKTTGLTIIKMDEEIDHGPIIDQETYTILETDYRSDLENKLTELAFNMFKKIINELQITDYELETKEQNHKEATYTKKLTKQDGFIKFKELIDLLKLTTNHQSLVTFYSRFRGLSPWPGIWTILPSGKRLKIIKVKLVANPHSLTPMVVQLEGKKEVDFKTFNEAYKLF